MTDLIESGGSWSGRERNCCFLNIGGGRQFANISSVSGLNFIDDGRAVAVVDWDHDGDLDLWLGNRTAPRIRFLRNDAVHNNHFLEVELIGRICNRDAIGARVELFLAGQNKNRHIRTVRAGDGFLSQSSLRVHFGLGASTKIARLVVNWPAGQAEEFSGLSANSHVQIVENSGLVKTWTPPPLSKPKKRFPTQMHREAGPIRVVLKAPLPLPTLHYNNFGGETVAIAKDRQGPLLINLWATWCAPCRGELQEFVRHQQDLTDRGLKVVALSVDGLRDDQQFDASLVEPYLRKLDFPFEAGFATDRLADKLDVIHDALLTENPRLDADFSLPVPTSFLIDRRGRLSVIYKGAVSVDQLLADVDGLTAGLTQRKIRAAADSGRWFWKRTTSSSVVRRMADRFLRRGYPADAEGYALLAADMIDREGSVGDSKPAAASLFSRLGDAFARQKRYEQATNNYRRALDFAPGLTSAREELETVRARQARADKSSIAPEVAVPSRSDTSPN